MKWLCTGDSWLEQCYLLKIVDDHDLRWLSTKITEFNIAIYWW